MSRNRSIPIVMSAPLAALAAFASGAGAFIDNTYDRDLEHFAAQAIGQDWITLFVAVPALLALAFAAWRGSRSALLLWHGVVFYLAYTYAIASFMVHFNALFLVYTTTFGMALLMLATSLATTIKDTPATAFGERWPRRTVAALLWAIVALFAFLWLSDIVPALFADLPPESLAESGGPTNGVEVIDLALLLPTAAMTGAWLLQRKARGYVIASGMLAFTALLGLALVGMVVALVDQGLEDSAAPALLFGALAATAATLAVLTARHTTNEPSTSEAAHA